MNCMNFNNCAIFSLKLIIYFDQILIYLDNFFMTKKFDYIICGAGLSGLIMVDKMFKDRFFDNKSVLLIEKDLSHKSQKTWCFWEEKQSMWDDYVIKSWDYVSFKSSKNQKETPLNH